MDLSSTPLIGLVGDTLSRGDATYYGIGDKYAHAVMRSARCAVLMIPLAARAADNVLILATLKHLDGVLVTGSPSDLDPALYGAAPAPYPAVRDSVRDATTLPLIRQTLAAGIPLLCICRGLQELNVALGGSLYQQVHTVPGKSDHREAPDLCYDLRYTPQHRIDILPGGLLQRLHPDPASAMVNSLHGQAIDRLAPGLRIEATAVDGVIEAVSVRDAPAFALGTQWHPEHPVALATPLNQEIFLAFGAAAQARRDARTA